MLERGRDGFFVVNHGSSLVDLHTELATQTVDDDVQVKLTHTADNRLTCLGVTLHGEGRILLRELAERNPELVEVLLGLGFDCDTDNGIRELHGFESVVVGFIADCVTRAQVFETYRRADVSRLHEIDGILVVGVHLIQAGDTLFAARA